MIKHVWTILCEKIITDQQTNQTSYLTALEGVNTGTFPAAIPYIALGVLWFKDSVDEEPLKFRIILISPNKDEKTLLETEQVLKAGNHRTNIVLNGYPVQAAGTYFFKVQVLKENLWTTASETPLVISLVDQSATKKK
ncbi:MAG: hypothetical protein HZB31_15445 [Nitrospirae bacterium]|nr:hypothetical protein [Nitrospirota bacterium]